MNLAFDNKLLSVLLRVAYIVIAAKAIALIVLWFLPGDGVNFIDRANVIPPYYYYNSKNIIEPSQAAPVEKAEEVKQEVYDLGTLILKGVYKTSKGGYIIVAEKSGKNTEVIGINESFKGYKLIEIGSDYAIFDKNGKSYKIVIQEVEKPKSFQYQKVENDADGVNQLNDKKYNIQKNMIKKYTTDFDSIWKDISIKEVRKGNKIEGFKVLRIRKDSPFDKLGLKVGDLIIKANNKKLETYADAFKIYKNIGKVDVLQLVVLRNNQEVEIIYEVN